ncbi:phosphatidylserine decarboxylase [uncultured Paracoccus sp.]|uniref:phosphatidylserine decarboxylase n=1 Tax=uncultured Paracoccus sp. TaxID=189685 RepID=UPI00261FD806|nr:phosphatidylserine decarboxylase [uncultured Paracoccus sp.]
MPIPDFPTPTPESIPELKPLLEHRADADFVALLQLSLAEANAKAMASLDPLLYAALPFADMAWPLTLDDYLTYLARFSRWIPQQSSDPAWLAPDSPLGEHQEIYDRLCFCYWLIDQPVGPNGLVIQDIPWFAEFLRGYAAVWGDFLDSTESFNDQTLQSFLQDSPEYRVQDSLIGTPPRPNEPSGWKTFNQFFARELNPGLRPIVNPADNRTIVAPADCTYKQHYQIGANGEIQPPITIKGTHSYATVQMLLSGSQYADAFNGGHFIHFFLGPYSYHRFHTPVAGVVKECYPLTGQVYLKVTLGGGQFQAADSSDDGYEFLQARGIITIDSSASAFGNVGIVAAIPVGMCQVSGVNMTHLVDQPCLKGDEFGYFTFGGSDIIVLTQAGVDVTYNPAFFQTPPPYSHYGSLVATVTPPKG